MYKKRLWRVQKSLPFVSFSLRLQLPHHGDTGTFTVFLTSISISFPPSYHRRKTGKVLNRSFVALLCSKLVLPDVFQPICDEGIDLRDRFITPLAFGPALHDPPIPQLKSKKRTFEDHQPSLQRISPSLRPPPALRNPRHNDSARNLPRGAPQGCPQCG